jgi:hypothetical protein
MTCPWTERLQNQKALSVFANIVAARGNYQSRRKSVKLPLETSLSLGGTDSI